MIWQIICKQMEMRLALRSTWTYLQSKTRSKRSVKASPIPATVPNSRHQSEKRPTWTAFCLVSLSWIPVSVPLPLWVRVRVRFMNNVSSVLFVFLLGPSLNLCLFYKSSMPYPLARPTSSSARPGTCSIWSLRLHPYVPQRVGGAMRHDRRLQQHR